MLSIAVVGASQAVNYYKKDNYYSEKESVETSQWFGKGADLLGLNGKIDFKTFEHLINGRDKNGKTLSDYSVTEEESKKKSDANKLTEKQMTELKANFSEIISQVQLKDFELHAINSALINAFKYKEKLSKTQSNVLKSKLAKILSVNAKNKKEREAFKLRLFEEIKKVSVVKERRAAFDLTFSAPKSVSIQALVFKDKEILEMHDKAVKRAIERCEREFSTIRVMTDGVSERKNVGNFTVAMFQHDTSRLLDPQLHTHCVVMNLTNDGKEWRALSNEEIMHHSKLLGMIYQNEFGRLLQEKGYIIISKGNGTFELASFSREQIEIFSKRSRQIKDLGALNQKEATKLVLVDRKAKDVNVPNFIKDKVWEESAKNANMTKDIPNKAYAFLSEKVISKINLDEEVLKSIKQLSERDVKFSKFQILQTTLENTLNKFSDEKIDIAIEKSLPNLISVMDGKKFTTHEALAIESKSREFVINSIKKYHKFLEQDLVDKIILNKDMISNSIKENTFNQIIDILDSKKIDELNKNSIMDSIRNKSHDTKKISGTELKSLKKEIWFQIKQTALTREEKKIAMIEVRKQLDKISGLTKGQAEAVRATLQSSDGVIIWQGNAGSGKTTSIRMIAEAVHENYNILGFSPSSKAAQELSNSIGIKANTVAELLKGDFNFENSDKKASLWIVDESSMLGAKQARDLFEKAHNNNARVILIGDSKQLASVEWGNPFKDIQRVAGTVCYLHESVRQKDPILDEAVQLLNADDMQEAIRHIKDDHIYVFNDKEKIAQTMAKEFLSLSDAERQETIVTGLTNESLLRLNNEIRAGLKAEGKLTDSYEAKTLKAKNLFENTQQYASSFEEGDIVSFQKNIKEHGIVRNDLYRVIHIDTLQNTIQIQNIKSNESASVDLSKKYAMSIFAESKIDICVGDRLMWSQNEKQKERVNKHLFQVINIDKEKNKMTIKYPHSEKIEEIDLREYLKANHAWSVTYYAAQGATVKNCLVADDKSATYNNMYVYMTRATNDMKIYTESYENMLERAGRKVSKNTATELVDKQKPRQILKETKDKKFKNIHFISDKEKAKERILNSLTNQSTSLIFRSQNGHVQIEKDRETLLKKDFFPDAKKNISELFLVAPQDVSSLFALSSSKEEQDMLLKAHTDAIEKSMQYIEKFVFKNNFDSFQINRTYALDKAGLDVVPMLSSSIYIENKKETSSYLLNQQIGIVKNLYENELAHALKAKGVELRIYDGEIRVNKVDRQVSQEFLKLYNKQLKGLGLQYYATLGDAEEKIANLESMKKIEIDKNILTNIEKIGELKEKISFQEPKNITQIKKEVISTLLGRNEIFNENDIMACVMKKSKGNLAYRESIECYLSVFHGEEFKKIGFTRDGRACFTSAEKFYNDNLVFELIKRRTTENTHFVSKFKVNEFIIKHELNPIVANNIDNIFVKQGGIKICSDLNDEDKSKFIDSIKKINEIEGFQTIHLHLNEKLKQGDETKALLKNVLSELEAGKYTFTKNQIVLIEQAESLGVQELNRLMLEAESVGAKIILVGSTKESGFTKGSSYALINGMIGINPHFFKAPQIGNEKNSQNQNSPEYKNPWKKELKNDAESKRLTDIMNKVAQYYNDNLYKNSFISKSALTYLDKSRGMDMQTIDRFSIGLSNQIGLIDYAKKNNISVSDLMKCGLVAQKENGQHYEFFRNRIMFPIRNEEGNVVAFGGRVFQQKDIEKKIAKYVNSKETVIYSKSQILYGLESAKEAIKAENKVYICEGYLDAIALKKAGIDNAVAVLGTALTKEHVELLKVHTNNIVLLFDSDKAGKDASIRSYFQTYSSDINLSITNIGSESKDADEFLKNNSASELRDALNRNEKAGEIAVAHLLREKHGENAWRAISEYQEKYQKLMNFSKNKAKKELDQMIISLSLGCGEMIKNSNDSDKYLSKMMKQNYSVPFDLENLNREIKDNSSKKIMEIVANINKTEGSEAKKIYDNQSYARNISNEHNSNIFIELLTEKLKSETAIENIAIDIDFKNFAERISDDIRTFLEKKNNTISISNEEIIKFYTQNLIDLKSSDISKYLNESLLEIEKNSLGSKLSDYAKEFSSKYSHVLRDNEFINSHYKNEGLSEFIGESFQKYKDKMSDDLSRSRGYTCSENEILKELALRNKKGEVFTDILRDINIEANRIKDEYKLNSIHDVTNFFDKRVSMFKEVGPKAEEILSLWNDSKYYKKESILYKNIEENLLKQKDFKCFSDIDSYNNDLKSELFLKSRDFYFDILEKTLKDLNNIKVDFEKSLDKKEQYRQIIIEEFSHLKKNYINMNEKIEEKCKVYTGKNETFKNDFKRLIEEDSKSIYKRKYSEDADLVTAILNFSIANNSEIDAILNKNYNLLLAQESEKSQDNSEISLKVLDFGLDKEFQSISNQLGLTQEDKSSLGLKMS
ncbi:MobF family relaxase [Fluviispira sanaruensis]|uniref:Toprim domain-containing protein n=1 Tax=Fluviispira sanaruensis TaxID=2493639 RepID=A0A4P2VY71_FLUSA|nr:MobF family relaxase [Fluviispira sanaruensis]BBH54635.1 hypothetical protein JCM31447_31090 [Fluviispira sanaruensis]